MKCTTPLLHLKRLFYERNGEKTSFWSPTNGKARQVDESFCVANSKVSPSENFFLKHALVFGTFPKHAVFIEPLKETANTNKRKAIYVTTCLMSCHHIGHTESLICVWWLALSPHGKKAPHSNPVWGLSRCRLHICKRSSHSWANWRFYINCT